MERGSLRVYLGPAPGAGKTYRMLDEGWRRKSRGTDVVIGFVETHGRTQTAAQIRDLEIVALARREHRGAQFDEMDLDAVLARHPAVALVDELAHTNAPGGRHPKRWRDVDDLLAAGIDVITTLNVQHLESINDVVEKITGISQRETVPDAFVRSASQIELVDITPEALRRRLAHGNVYAPEKIDVALANYFREGNLSALRELALLWLADRVEIAIQRYQGDHGIAATWETRERLLVGVTGTDADAIVLRRAARFAARSNGDFIAVHVVAPDSDPPGENELAVARRLVEELGARLDELVDDDVAAALIDVARREHATQVVLGSSRSVRGRHSTSGVVERVLRGVRDLDVHIIAVTPNDPNERDHRPNRHSRGAGARRRIVAAAVTVGALALLTAVLTNLRVDVTQSTVFLAYLIVVLAVTTWGGVAVGVAAAIAAAGLENYYFVAPIHTLEVARPNDLVALLGFLALTGVTSVTLRQLADRTRDAARARAESAVLSRTVATLVDSGATIVPLLNAVRTALAGSRVEILECRDGQWVAVAASDDPVRPGEEPELVDVDPTHRLATYGLQLDRVDRVLLRSCATYVALELRRDDARRVADELATAARHHQRDLDVVGIVAPTVSSSLARLDDYLGVSPRRPSDHGDDATPIESLRWETQRLHDAAWLLSSFGHGSGSMIRDASLLEIIDRAASRATPPGCSLEIIVNDDSLSVRTDPDRLSVAIAALLRHAGRSGPVSAPVRVDIGTANGAVEVMIIDRGRPVDRARLADLGSAVPHLSPIDEIETDLTMGIRVARDLDVPITLDDTPGGGLTVTLRLAASPRPTNAPHGRA